MDSILFDTVQLVNSTYNVSRSTDNTTAERNINTLETEGVNGVVMLNDRFGAKIIEIRGVLVGSSASDLQTKIDSANELFSRKDVNMDILPSGGSTRRYVVRLIGAVEYDRDYYHVDWCPFRARFFVAEGVGKDTSALDVLEHYNTTQERDPTPTGSSTIALAGSATPTPEISFTLHTIGKLDLITITDDDTGEEMSIEIDDSYSNSDEVIISLAEQAVKKNGVSVPFNGQFPVFDIGNNTLHVDYQGATLVLDQEQSTEHNNGLYIGNLGGTKRVLAQSFIPEKSGRLSQMKIWANTIGTPGNMTVDLYTDNGNLPYETMGVLFSQVESDFPSGLGSADEVTLDNGNDLYLRKGVKYWLVFRTSDSAGDYYNIHVSGSTDYYSDGKLLQYEGAVTVPTDPADWVDISATYKDMYFKTYNGQGGSADWTVSYVISYTKRYL